jgi:PIN domain nuclease of toxin-antitoxin system
MVYLMDTHTFFWHIGGNPALSVHARAVIEQEGNVGYVSIVSIWELAIKVGLGKLTLAEPFHPYLSNQITQNGFDILPIQVEHTAKIVGMPHHHRDPFDRLIIAQSLVENIPILSVDTIFDDYDVQRIW